MWKHQGRGKRRKKSTWSNFLLFLKRLFCRWLRCCEQGRSYWRRQSVRSLSYNEGAASRDAVNSSIIGKATASENMPSLTLTSHSAVVEWSWFTCLVRRKSRLLQKMTTILMGLLKPLALLACWTWCCYCFVFLLKKMYYFCWTIAGGVDSTRSLTFKRTMRVASHEIGRMKLLPTS